MKLIMLVSALGISTSLLAGGGDGHVHEAAVEAAPRGGNLRNAGEFKAELVLKGDVAKIYIYDKKLKPINPTATNLSGEVEFPKKKRQPITLTKVGDAYEGKMDGISKVHRYDLHFKFEEGDKKAVLDFGVDNI